MSETEKIEEVRQLAVRMRGDADAAERSRYPNHGTARSLRYWAARIDSTLSK